MFVRSPTPLGAKNHKGSLQLQTVPKDSARSAAKHSSFHKCTRAEILGLGKHGSHRGQASRTDRQFRCRPAGHCSSPPTSVTAAQSSMCRASARSRLRRRPDTRKSVTAAGWHVQFVVSHRCRVASAFRRQSPLPDGTCTSLLVTAAEWQVRPVVSHRCRMACAVLCQSPLPDGTCSSSSVTAAGWHVHFVVSHRCRVASAFRRQSPLPDGTCSTLSVTAAGRHVPFVVSRRCRKACAFRCQSPLPDGTCNSCESRARSFVACQATPGL